MPVVATAIPPRSHRPHVTLYRPKRRTILQLVLAAALLYILVPLAQGSNNIFQLLTTANPLYLVYAALAILASYAFAATTYWVLAFHAVPYRRILLVQLAGCFVNRLLPAGLGGLGLNALFLKRQGHTGAQAAAVVATNNLLGVLGNILLLFLATVFLSLRLPSLAVPGDPQWQIVALLTVIAGLLFLLRRRLRLSSVSEFLGKALEDIRRYRKRPHDALLAVMSNMALTALHVAVLLLVAAAINLQIPAVQVLVVVSIGTFAAVAIPSPGGLGSAEAGLYAALVAYGHAPAVALTAALLYRGITYWLPLLPGYLIFLFVERRYL